jgi:hypothetical protein
MTQQVAITPTIEEQAEPKCRHYWVIQPADGPVSQGKCQNCGETREFKNYVEASTWGDDKSASRSRVDVVPAVSDHRGEEDEE